MSIMYVLVPSYIYVRIIPKLYYQLFCSVENAIKNQNRDKWYLSVVSNKILNRFSVMSGHFTIPGGHHRPG